jgi:hypothetical protein
VSLSELVSANVFFISGDLRNFGLNEESPKLLLPISNYANHLVTKQLADITIIGESCVS